MKEQNLDCPPCVKGQKQKERSNLIQSRIYLAQMEKLMLDSLQLKFSEWKHFKCLGKMIHIILRPF